MLLLLFWLMVAFYLFHAMICSMMKQTTREREHKQTQYRKTEIIIKCIWDGIQPYGYWSHVFCLTKWAKCAHIVYLRKNTWQTCDEVECNRQRKHTKMAMLSLFSQLELADCHSQQIHTLTQSLTLYRSLYIDSI